MRTYRVNVVGTSAAYYEIEAKNQKEAEKKAARMEFDDLYGEEHFLEMEVVSVIESD